MLTPYGSDASLSSDDEPGPSTRRHFDVSSASADPDVLAPIIDAQHARKRVHYYHSPLIGSFSYGYGHPMKPHRMRMAHSLITAYGLDKCMVVREPKEADKVDMTRFHTDEYIDFLERVNPENGQALTGQGSRFLIGEDCPPFPSVFQFCSLSSGGSISAAQSINSGAADIAINWAGGLHHAKKREASGFCYTNDIVLGILELLRVHPRVLYIDIDIHHGDGVEEAFYSTNRVMSISFHKFGDFFPGTGDVKDVGIGEGKGYAVNVPLRDGIGDDDYQRLLFRPMIQHIMDWYRPGAVVLQCGADSLAGDKLGCFNLSMRGHAACVSFLQSFNVPLICVGGGGYTVRNVARTWTYETALLLGRQPDEDLPFNEYMNWFGPEYKLDVRPTSMENLNSDAYLEGLRSRVVDNLRCLPFAPSVQLQATPRYGLNAHAEGELSDSGGENGGELEKKVEKALRRAELQRQMESPQSDSDSDDDEEGHASQSRPLKRDLSSTSLQRNSKPVLWSGNRSLEERRRHAASMFEREDSVTSSIGSTSKAWLSGGFTPTGFRRDLSGPPEALRQILAAKLASSQQNGSSRRRGHPASRDPTSLTASKANGTPRYDSDADMDSEMEDGNEDEADYDGDDHYDDDESEDDASVRAGFRNGYIRNGTRPTAAPTRLTKTGRPRRSFFDSAQPYRPWVLNDAKPPLPAVRSNDYASGNGIADVVSLDMDVDLERERELERGRRGEGGGSQLLSPFPPQASSTPVT
ncbi:unnamed protein product [Parajaminaea phylloscopi]